MSGIIKDSKMKTLTLFLLALLMASCSNRQASNAEIALTDEPDTLCNTPQCMIYIQPYNGFKSEEANKLLPVLKLKMDSLLYGYWEFCVLPPIPLPDSTHVKDINRYRATAILRHEQRLLKGNEVIIGLTHEDICMDVHGKKDYGIIGCSFRPGQVCIVSDKRLKNKRDFWKPVVHEFIHAFYGAPHCPEDNDFCLMQDARGKANFATKDSLCYSCRH